MATTAHCAPLRKRAWVGRKQREREKNQKNKVEKNSLDFPYFQQKPKASLRSVIIVKIRVTLAEASARGAAKDAEHPRAPQTQLSFSITACCLWSGASAISSQAGGLLLSDPVQHFILACPC